ncbi:MAG: methyltransferase [Maribacter sp.]|nr:methyltransferase [Maribacter sp.]
MIQQIDRHLLTELSLHTRKLSIKRFFKSMGPERCGELPFIVSQLTPLFSKKLRLLDIGSGDSVFPTYILKKTNWDVTCIDKFSSIQQQHIYARKIMGNSSYESRFHVLEKDFLLSELPEKTFDIITNISVIEHFEGDRDSLAMKNSSKLLKSGGLYYLTTLINDGFFKEFFINKDSYGQLYKGSSVFYQRHYDVPSFDMRIVKASGLKEIKRIYQGEYGFQFVEYFLNIPWPFKPLKIFYQWATPFFARRFLTYRNYPMSRPEMHIDTSSCVIIVLKRDD